MDEEQPSVRRRDNTLVHAVKFIHGSAFGFRDRRAKESELYLNTRLNLLQTQSLEQHDYTGIHDTAKWSTPTDSH
jgi:hypothetical protein